MEQSTLTYASVVMHLWAVVTWNTALQEEDFRLRGNVQKSGYPIGSRKTAKAGDKRGRLDEWFEKVRSAARAFL